MEIREVRPEEYEEAGRVVARAYAEFVPPDPSPGWREYVRRLADVAGRAGRTVVLVAVEDGRILGSATIELHQVIGDDDRELPPGAAVLRMLGVSPEARRRGVARALVRETIRRAREAGKQALLLRTTPAMGPAQALYRSMGFERDPGLDLASPEVSLLGYRLDLAGRAPEEVSGSREP